MTVDELRDKVSAAELKVEKCKKTIERHRVQMEKKAKQLWEMGIDPEAADKYSFVQNGSDMNREAYWLLCDYDGKKNDIKSATEKLEDSERILGNWQAKLDLQINQEKIINDAVPQVLKDFLESWKERAFEWYVGAYNKFIDFKASLRREERLARLEAFNTLPEYAESRERHKKIWGDEEPSDSTLLNMYPGKPMEDFLKERDLDYKSIRERLAARSDGIILKMCEFRDEGVRNTWLEKTLEEEKKAKLIDLFNRVSDICGPVTDATGLRVHASGDLGGNVIGEKGIAFVQTIGAGGYNIQCFHYRTLIRDVTEKVKEKPVLDSVIHSCEIMSKKNEKNINKDKLDFER